MAWERRGKTATYYYRSVRRDGQVKKLYLGKGSAAHKAAKEAAIERANLEAGNQLISREEMKTATACQLSKQVETLSTCLMDAVLLGAGFWRQNYSRWRKRRGN
jgi:hypothetical protein